jgi:uncharacterized protein
MVNLAALVLLIRLPVMAGLALALCGCTGLIFQPMRELVLTPDEIGLDYREIELQAADGVRLHGWLLPAAAPPRGSVLFLHGNAQNISTHIASVAWLPAEGFDVLLLDYRGYGRSGGSPSLAGLQLDFEAALDSLLARPETKAGPVIVFGQSLGGALAITALAGSPRRKQVRALIVEGAFTSYRALAREKLADFWLTWPLQAPLGLAIDDRYRPIDAIGELAPMPVLIVHGEDDRVVPPDHAIALYEAAWPPKTLWLVPGAGHIHAFTTAANRARLILYLKGVSDEPAPPTTRPAGAAGPELLQDGAHLGAAGPCRALRRQRDGPTGAPPRHVGPERSEARHPGCRLSPSDVAHGRFESFEARLERRAARGLPQGLASLAPSRRSRGRSRLGRAGRLRHPFPAAP